MSNSIITQIISPLKTEFNGELSYIEVPTETGIIGIYPNHISLLTSLTKGLLKITLKNGKSLKFNIQNGFLRLHENHCNITTKNLISC